MTAKDVIEKMHLKIGDEVYVHGYIDEIRTDCIIIRNSGGYFGTALNEIESVKDFQKVPEDELITECRNSQYYKTCEYKNRCNPAVCFKALDELNNRIKNNQSECTHFNMLSETECDTCEYNTEEWYSEACDGCTKNNSHYKPIKNK